VSLLTVIGVGLLGGCGAVLRHLLDGSVSARLPMTFPIGILVVNLTGAFALGLLAGVTSDETTLRLFGVGLIGSLTTFSAWMFDSVWLGEEGERGAAVANVAVGLIGGLLIAWIGLHVGEGI
jgi:fluoride exporter